MDEQERIIELETALKAAEVEVDKWRTGAEIYEAQVGDLQGALQEMAAELDRLALENQQLKQQTSETVVMTPQPMVADQNAAIIQDALINKIKQLQAQLNEH
ncbi:hypothetical protein [Weissella confusa]|uniref:Uncharacterized protein n=1 Tax=Weissella confusa TaxID=1583 RepID=A0A4Z0RVQ0_WEICO|nr:hypothetical protein [Weissella confusa]TGE70494.1 hypothetical protein C6P11_10295 [Weissella confusa]